MLEKQSDSDKHNFTNISVKRISRLFYVLFPIFGAECKGCEKYVDFFLQGVKLGRCN